MAHFRNAQRASLWADKPQSGNEEEEESPEINESEDFEEELKKVDDELRERINTKINPFNGLSSIPSSYFRLFYKISKQKKSRMSEKNFAEHRQVIVLPAQSTQELSIIIQIAELLPRKIEPNVPTSKKLPTSWITNLIGDQIFLCDDLEAIKDESHDRSRGLTVELMTFFRAPLPERRSIEIVKQYLWLGVFNSKMNWIAAARRFYHCAYVFSDALKNKDPLFHGNVCVEHAKFLEANGWQFIALEVLNKALQDLFTKEADNTDQTSLQADILDRTEFLYNQAFAAIHKNGKLEHPRSAHFLEKIALAQICQENYEEAEKNYTWLLAHEPLQKGILLSNLGFMKRRQGQVHQATIIFKRALEEFSRTSSQSLSESQNSINGFAEIMSESPKLSVMLKKVERKYTSDTNKLFALSGLYECFQNGIHVNSEEHIDIVTYLIKYFDVNRSLFSSGYD
ncbi:MAG: hypothetical protein Q9167_003655 [Letrouitia subvulpina]